MNFASRRLNTRTKRVLFVLTAIPATGLIVMLVASGYFYYQIHFSDYGVTAFCHDEVAWQEMGLSSRPAVSSDEYKKIAKSSRERMRHRWSSEVRAIENGDVFQQCLQETYLVTAFMNLQGTLTEARNFALWTAVPLVLFSLFLMARSLFRWTMMR